MFTLEKDLKEKQKETGMRVQMELDYLFIKKKNTQKKHTHTTFLLEE